VELQPLNEPRIGEPLEPALRRRHRLAAVDSTVDLAAEYVAKGSDHLEHLEIRLVRLEIHGRG